MHWTATAMRDSRPTRLTVEERRQAVLEIVNREGRVMIADISRQFRISVVTARADLTTLAGRDLLVRSHGGALRKTAAPEWPIQVHGSDRHEQKMAIGRAAAELVKDGHTVLLDSGTTTLEVARAIRNRKLSRVTIVTNSLAIAWEVSGVPEINLVMIGGILRHISRSFAGPQAQKMLADVHVDHFFLGVDGLDPEVGPSTSDILEAGLNLAMIRSATEVSVVTDSSKIGRSSLSVIAGVTSLRRIITDSEIELHHCELLRAKGVEVLVASIQASAVTDGVNLGRT